MGIEKPADIESSLRPTRPDDLPEPGYEEWLAEEIAAGIAELDAGQSVTLDAVMRELGLEQEAS